MSILKRKNLIAKSPLDTGKTTCYCIALLQLRFIDPNIQKHQALILSHKEDQVRYIHEMLLNLGQRLKVNVETITEVPDELGKERDEDQEGFKIIVTTPDIACDMAKKGYLKLDQTEIIVIDDADKMIAESAALENLKEILNSTNTDAQKVMFTSTIIPEIISLSEKFLEDPAKIVVKEDEFTLDGIKQFYVNVGKEECRNETLKEIYDNLDIQQSLIYCNTVQQAVKLETWMKDKDLSVISINEDMDRRQKDQNINLWRRGDYRILITTGALKREYACVSVDILYNLPPTNEKYLRLIGRKGRFGRKGVVVALVTKNDMESLKETEKYFNTEILELPFHLSSIYD